MNPKNKIAYNQHQALPEFVHNELRRAILNGVFAPGQVLRQEEVAASMGVSRSPLREALTRLEAEGIVVLTPRRGYAVAELRPDEIKEVFELRILLESKLAMHAIAKRSEADIALAYDIANQMRQLSESGADETMYARWSDLNLSFHDALLQAAQMPHHMRSLNTARSTLESYIRAEVRLTGNLLEAQIEHTELVQAFMQGHAETFVTLTVQHSLHTRDRLLAGIDSPRFPFFPLHQAAVDQPNSRKVPR